ncbi:MAG: hypothetical protein ACK4PR_08930, partial [Gammaproteobacteria bacterium]
QNKNNLAVPSTNETTAEQVGALVQVQGRAERARAIALGMPAALSISKEGTVGSGQTLAIGSLDPSLSESSKKFLYEKVIDNTFSDNDPVVKAIQEQLSFLRDRLRQPAISKDDAIALYNQIDQQMAKLMIYQENQQKQRATSTASGSFFNQGFTSQGNQSALAGEKSNNNFSVSK